jgi:hypothetical protein
VIARYRKAIAALLGAVTPAIVVLILGLVHVHVDPTLAAGVCTLCGFIATVLAPANTPKPQALRPTD